MIHAVDSAVTDCQPNANVEALRVFMLAKKVECRPVWKPMHKQPVYCEGSAVVSGCGAGCTIHLGEGVLIGAGAVVIQRLSVGSWTVVGAGTVVIDNIEGQEIVAGVPASAICHSSKE